MPEPTVTPCVLTDRTGDQALFDEELTRAEMVDAGEAWRPFRSYASRYLWKASD